MMTMMETGSAMAGPFACTDSVQFHVHSMSDNMNTLMTSPIYKMNCDANAVSESTPINTLIFPNPANHNFTLSAVPTNAKINIRDTQGRLIYQDVCTHSKNTIDCKNWSNGIYFVEIKDNLNTQQLKLQVIH
jgi:hypothetical protein